MPDDVVIHQLPFPDQSSVDGDAPHESAFRRMMSEQPADGDVSAAARRYMTSAYKEFPTLRGARRAVQQVVSLLIDGRPVIAHCFAGKDRTGFTVATVLAAAGVDRDAVMADYLRSNDAVPQLRGRILSWIRDRYADTPELETLAEARLTDAVLGVEEDYLAISWRTIDEEFGSLSNFLSAADVSADDVARLRDVLLG